MNNILDTMQEMLEEGFTQEEAQFIAADRCFGSIAYNDYYNNYLNKNIKEEKQSWLHTTVHKDQ